MPKLIIVGYDPNSSDPSPVAFALRAARFTGAPLAVASVGSAVAVDYVELKGSSAARALHEAAEERDAGLLVVGSTARGAVGRVLPDPRPSG